MVLYSPLERVTTVSVHVHPSLGCTVVTEEHQSGMVTISRLDECMYRPDSESVPFWRAAKEIKGRIVVEKEVLWVS